MYLYIIQILGYKQYAHMCTHLHTPIARVVIPPETVILEEGSIANPTEIVLNLSASSYGFNVSIDIESMLQDSTPMSVLLNFVNGESQAVSEIICTCTLIYLTIAHVHL